jgi:hypothetical protein
MMEQLSAIRPRGTTGIVWTHINLNVAAGEYDKKKLMTDADISSSHLDKISSELLTKCYQVLFGHDRVALLEYLCKQRSYTKLFYTELGRQLRLIKGMDSSDQQAAFIRECFRIIHTGLPMSYREPNVSERMSKQYVALFRGAAKKEAELYVGCKLLYEKIDRLFAASAIRMEMEDMEAEFLALGSLHKGYSADTAFDYYWTQIFLYHADENFDKALSVAQYAMSILAEYTGAKNELNVLRVRLKISEFLYFLNRFSESYDQYSHALASRQINMLPDRPYHINKFLQICMITNHLSEVGSMLSEKLKIWGDKMPQQIITRDVITFIKYYLINAEYDKAFVYLKLGFDKNDKGKYFQYELELRNLQTAYFYLSGQPDVVIDMCKKHLKFLRNHGYNVSNSDYTHYYVLVNAILSMRKGDRLSKRHQKMYDRYQQGSFAIYGRLLDLILNR